MSQLGHCVLLVVLLAGVAFQPCTSQPWGGGAEAKLRSMGLLGKESPEDKSKGKGAKADEEAPNLSKVRARTPGLAACI